MVGVGGEWRYRIGELRLYETRGCSRGCSRARAHPSRLPALRRRGACAGDPDSPAARARPDERCSRRGKGGEADGARSLISREVTTGAYLGAAMNPGTVPGLSRRKVEAFDGMAI